MLVFPERPHHLHLLLGSASTVVEILVQTDELDLVPTDADPPPEPPFAQHVQTCRLFRDQRGLALCHDQDAGGER
jgi:hypothetical protein